MSPGQRSRERKGRQEKDLQNAVRSRAFKSSGVRTVLTTASYFIKQTAKDSPSLKAPPKSPCLTHRKASQGPTRNILVSGTFYSLFSLSGRFFPRKWHGSLSHFLRLSSKALAPSSPHLKLYHLLWAGHIPPPCFILPPERSSLRFFVFDLLSVSLIRR